MTMNLMSRLRVQLFLPSRWAVAINPAYIIRRGLYKAIRSIAPSIRGEVLDFGCGSKPYESLFTAAKSYLGVDLEVSGHSHAASKVDVFYDGKRLPFETSRFDSVVCFEVLEHVFNIDEIMVEVARVLKPGGQFLLTIPFAWDEHEAPYDFARYTSFGIRAILERNGFAIVEMKKSTTYFLAVCQLMIAYLYQHVLPRGNISAKICQLFVVFPCNAIALVLNALLPKRYDYYCNNIVLSRKMPVHSADASAVA